MLATTLDGQLALFGGRILPFDTDAARRYADIAVAARNAGKGFPTPDGYIAAIAAAHGFAVATRVTSAFHAANVPVIDPWKAGR
jgi:predicted nucleic acid-binding protein